VTGARRAALIVELVRKLRNEQSWAGETHVQKTAYVLEALLGVPLGLQFSLYKYGPYSFELRDQLGEMRGLDQLELQPQPYPYGPKLAVGPGAAQLRTRFPKTLRKFDRELSFVAKEVGPLGVGDLERLATALLVTEEFPGMDVERRAGRLNRYKPHVPLEQARDAVRTVDELAERATAAGLR
jgi:hypothetical protein